MNYVDISLLATVMPDCIRRHSLTPGEARVLTGVFCGSRPSDLAVDNQRSTKTVSTQKRSAFRKMGVSTDAEFVHYFYYLSGVTTQIATARKNRME